MRVGRRRVGGIIAAILALATASLGLAGAGVLDARHLEDLATLGRVIGPDVGARNRVGIRGAVDGFESGV